MSYTYSDGTIETYFKQDAVMDLAPLLEEYAEYLTDMTEFFGTNLTWKLDPNEGTIYAIPAVRIETSRVNTFVREDWLEKLGLSIPTTTQEFEEMLVAFKDNAETPAGRRCQHDGSVLSDGRCGLGRQQYSLLFC